MIFINFLPLKQKEKIRWQLINRFVLFYCFLFVSITVAFIATMFVFNYFLKTYRDDLKEQVEGFKQGKLAVQVVEAENKIKDKNKEIEAILLLKKNNFHWSPILENIIKNVPEGISLSSLNLQEEGKVAVIGHADTREHLLDFKSNLEQSEYISVVVLPFDDLTRRTDIDFSMNFVLKEGILQGSLPPQ